MLSIILVLFAGIIIGYLFRKKDTSFLSMITTVFIWLLLFFLGISVGSNDALLDNILVLGWDAWVITFGALLGSLILSKLVYIKFFKNDKPQ
ncbi:MAG: LysO family transporter [Bacteroidales bacterium]